MKVYIVFGEIDYVGDTVIGVFATQGLADAHIERVRHDRSKRKYDGYSVEEWEVLRYD